MGEFLERAALVRGANRGIGLEVTRDVALRGFTTILGARDAQKGGKVARSLRRNGLKVMPIQLDVIEQKSLDAAKHLVEERISKLDVLVSNFKFCYRTQV